MANKVNKTVFDFIDKENKVLKMHLVYEFNIPQETSIANLKDRLTSAYNEIMIQIYSGMNIFYKDFSDAMKNLIRLPDVEFVNRDTIATYHLIINIDISRFDTSISNETISYNHTAIKFHDNKKCFVGAIEKAQHITIEEQMRI